MSAWTVIAHTELTSGSAADITFMSVGNIPNTYTDLLLVASLRSTAGGDRADLYLTFNANTGSNYSSRRVIGYDSNSILSDSFSGTPTQNGSITAVGNTATASAFGNLSVYIPNYTSTVDKSYSVDFVNGNYSSAAYILGIVAGKFTSNSALTSIKLSLPTGSFAQYSSATLYGITKGSSGGVTVS